MESFAASQSSHFKLAIKLAILGPAGVIFEPLETKTKGGTLVQPPIKNTATAKSLIPKLLTTVAPINGALPFFIRNRCQPKVGYQIFSPTMPLSQVHGIPTSRMAGLPPLAMSAIRHSPAVVPTGSERPVRVEGGLRKGYQASDFHNLMFRRCRRGTSSNYTFEMPADHRPDDVTRRGKPA